MTAPPTVAVMGAGSIGCWAGGLLAAAGLPVTLIGRERLRESVSTSGLTVVTLDGKRHHVDVSVSTTPDGAAGASHVLVAVKGGDTAAAAAAVRPHLAPDTVVVSLQNGLRNPDRLRAALPGHRVVPGMVSFNVVWGDGATFTQTTSGPIALARGGAPALAAALRARGVPVVEVPDMQGVQWAKLILNLNNAVNALSGVGLRDELSQRGYRRVLAAAMREAWRALRAAGLRPVPVGRMRPALAPWILPLPDRLFRALAAPMIRIDPAARSSMADDLARGRRTEVRDINGEVVALGAHVGVSTPVNDALVRLVEAAAAAGGGSPGLGPEQLLERCRL